MHKSSVICGLLLGILIGCNAATDTDTRIAKYRDAKLSEGLSLQSVKKEIGEPDTYSDYWIRPGGRVKYTTDFDDFKTSVYTSHVESLGYGPFGAHNQKTGHVTKHRLSLTFVDGKLHEWERSAPIDNQ
ncbi:MAG: hypothetical protein WD648_11545 [Planctomycetaceae bacterium]